LALDYSSKRSAFGKKISEHALTSSLLKEAEAELTRLFHFTFLVAEIFGCEEVYSENNLFQLSRDDLNKILRLLTPVLKLYTAKKTVLWTSELLEVFGGAGYIEDTTIPTLYRDAQVFPIWEGTTNVLSLDLLRALKKDQTWQLLINFLTSEISKVQKDSLKKHKELTLKELSDLNTWMTSIQNDGEEKLEAEARSLAFKIGDVVSKTAWLRNLHYKK
jgi:putative acyl-CoA dehydrogenase